MKGLRNKSGKISEINICVKDAKFSANTCINDACTFPPVLETCNVYFVEENCPCVEIYIKFKIITKLLV